VSPGKLVPYRSNLCDFSVINNKVIIFVSFYILLKNHTNCFDMGQAFQETQTPIYLIASTSKYENKK
jgi:hypothetical protein